MKNRETTAKTPRATTRRPRSTKIIVPGLPAHLQPPPGLPESYYAGIDPRYPYVRRSEDGDFYGR